MHNYYCVYYTHEVICTHNGAYYYTLQNQNIRSGMQYHQVIPVPFVCIIIVRTSASGREVSPCYNIHLHITSFTWFSHRSYLSNAAISEKILLKFRYVVTRLILAVVKPHKPVSSSTLPRWLLEKTGIHTGIFKVNSVRGAATSAAANAGVTMADILKAAHRSSESVFTKFY